MDTAFLDSLAGSRPLLLAVAAGGALLVFVLFRLLSGPRRDAHTQRAECPDCGWQGTVSRYAGRCPRCNSPLGDRKARK